ncbi:hypothetical protein BHE90_000072 [Fusarium euwallaceae]|uniref:Uncharacterized protein n=2 Tax=Fusarium solani species complex TaxID=232080 RepID=A0A3M2SE41_9HYPO|nr:hypothetical protein CDV36_004489 [Fusarium kuroshium]RTE85331.1 hypothetical protein BHE90_000072 [Fusarium euwallaceae]
MTDRSYRQLDVDAPIDWTQPPPNDHFSYFTDGQDNTVILKTIDTFTLRRTDRFSTQKLHVYAETIRLDGNIKLPGKELGLFCNKLLLPDDKLSVSISVAGKVGDDCAPNQTPSDNNHGQHGGNIILSVEEFDPQLLPTVDGKQKKIGLYLEAHGGNGGRGATSTSSNDDGGSPGANGGNGGNITVYFGHHLLGVINNLLSLVNDPGMPWLGKLAKLRDYDFHGEMSLKNMRRLIEASKNDIEAMKPVDEIRQMLKLMDFDDAPEGISECATQLSHLIERFQQSPTEIKVPHDTVQKSRKVLDNLRQIYGPFTTQQWQDFQDSTALLSTDMSKALETSTGTAGSKIQAVVADVVKELRARVNEVPKFMKFSYGCKKGSGGLGGQGANADSPHGTDGEPGKLDGKLRVEVLDFSGSDQSLSLPDAVAHPDQCQMLLNIADLKYFAASGGETVQSITQQEMKKREVAMARTLAVGEDQKFGKGEQQPDISFSYGDARALYQKLLRRLHFVPALKRQLRASSTQDLPELSQQDQAKFSLAAAYASIFKDKLCLDPIVQLLQVYDHTVQRLNWSSMGMDFMGHEGLWAPRLTYKFYETELEGFAVKAAELAKSLADTQSRDKAQAAIERSHSNCQLQLDGIETRIRLLTAVPNGELILIGSQIAEYTPILRAKRLLLQSRISNAKVGIEKTWNWDPKIILDALCMIAFCPNELNIAAQVANGVYKAATTVQRVDGNAVETSYVVSQFGDAGSTLDKLAEAYRARPDGSISVDDPGASKLLSTKATLDDLLKSFRAAIPDLSATIEKQLESYLSIIERRNKAVMDYNASLQLLTKAYADREFYEQRDEELGQLQLSTYNPESPSMRLWLLKYRQDLRYNILSTLYRGERALQFWGLVDSLAPIPAAEDFSDLDLLKVRADVLRQRFKDALTTRANNPGTVWPEVGHCTNSKGKGKFFHLHPDDVAHFRDHPTELHIKDADPPRTDLLYEAYFTIPPARKGDSKTSTDFAGHADVRIDSVRAWLYGASVAKRDNKAELAITLVHLGNDSIVREDNVLFEFNHDAVTLGCTYDPTNVQDAADIPRSTCLSWVWETKIGYRSDLVQLMMSLAELRANMVEIQMPAMAVM